MKKILRGRFSFPPVVELRIVGGEWRVGLELYPSVEQVVYMSGFIKEHGYNETRIPLEISSSTHKTLLRPAILSDARIDLINRVNKGGKDGCRPCKLEICFARTLSPGAIIRLKLISRSRGTLDNDLTGYIPIEIPTKEIQSMDMSYKGLLRGFVLPEQFPSGALVGY